MWDNIVIGFAVVLASAGVVSLVIAKRMLREFFSWMEQAQRTISMAEDAELSMDPIPSTRFPDFAIVPPSAFMIPGPGVGKKLEVGTRVH